MNKRHLLAALCLAGLSLTIWLALRFIPDKSHPIIFERTSTDEYSYITYREKDYLPFSPCSPNDRSQYLGHLKDDEQDEIYTYKDYSADEWLLNYLDTGLMPDCMLLKERDTTNIPAGLSSEYPWWTPNQP